MTGIGWLVMLVGFVAPAAHAGETVLQNNDHETFDYADYTDRMLEGECFGSVFVPDDGSIPFTLKYIDAMIGGSTETKVFTVDFYEVDVETSWSGSMELLASDSVAITGLVYCGEEAEQWCLNQCE
jgi:hypothetical protein